MKDLKGSVALVTGGSGFVGANVVRHLLANGVCVHLLLRPTTNRWRLSGVEPCVTVHEGDITNPTTVRTVLRRVRPHFIVHCAMSSGHPCSPDEERNAFLVSALGTLNLLQAALSLGVEKFVHSGSSMEYGTRSFPLAERLSLRPNTFRGLAKACAATICDYFARRHALPIVNLRLFSVYGPWEAPNRFVPTVLRAALWGGEVPLTANDAYHDFVFVGDVADAYLKALATPLPSGSVFNIGTGKQWSNRQVVEVTARLVGRPIAVKVGAHPQHPTDTPCWVANIDKARRLLHWQPTHELPDGLQATMEWMQRHDRWYRKASRAAATNNAQRSHARLP